MNHNDLFTSENSVTKTQNQSHNNRWNSIRLFFGLAIVCCTTTGSLRAQQWGDYTLYSLQNSTSAQLVDTDGTSYHSWTFPSTAKTGYSSYLLSGGTLLRAVARTGNYFTGGPICGEVQKVDWNGNVTWDFIYSTQQYCTHHDICPMPNGNVLLIAYESKTAAEVTQAGSSLNIVMWPDKIVEVQPSGTNGGTIVWEWHAWDHLVQNHDSTKDNYQSSILAHPELLNINYNTAKDWMHMNGVNYNAELNQIVFSCHNLNEIYVIDHSTTTAQAAGHTGGNSGKGGDFLYRWGNPAAYGATGTNVFHVVHDAHWVPKGCPRANYLVGYNNNGISTSQSCVDIIAPPYNGSDYAYTAGTAYAPSNYTYRHACNGHNSNMGNSQQLPNGNMLVCIAQSGYIYEIDSNQAVIWSKSVSGSTAKAFRYSACWVDGSPAPTPTITETNDTLISSEAVSYQWYYNSSPIPLANNQTYHPTADGPYQVQITDAGGCVSLLSASHSYINTGISTPIAADGYTVYPNPSSGIFDIRSLTSNEKKEIKVYDALGNLLLNDFATEFLDLSSFENGIYYLSIQGNSQQSVNHKIILMH